MFNLISALTSFIGLAIGILITPIDTDSYIFAFAGGMFLYISLGAMVGNFVMSMYLFHHASFKYSDLILFNVI